MKLRGRWAWLDHVLRAASLYSSTSGGRLAAACAYFAFLAVFPLVLLAFSVLGFVFRGNPAVTRAVSDALAQNLPVLKVSDIQSAKNTAGILGLIGFFFAGLGWVDGLRTSMRALWKRDESPGNVIVRKAVDASVLIGLGVVTGLSLLVTSLASGGAAFVFRELGLSHSTAASVGLAAVGFALGLGVNVVLFLVMFTAVPRIRQPFRRLLWPAVISALGLEILKTVGTLYVGRTSANPAYKAVAVAVGLLVFLNLLHQLILFCVAIGASGRDAPVRDAGEGGELVDPADRSEADCSEDRPSVVVEVSDSGRHRQTGVSAG